MTAILDPDTATRESRDRVLIVDDGGARIGAAFAKAFIEAEASHGLVTCRSRSRRLRAPDPQREAAAQAKRERRAVKRLRDAYSLPATTARCFGWLGDPQCGGCRRHTDPPRKSQTWFAIAPSGSPCPQRIAAG